VVGDKELALEDGVVVGHADEFLVVRVHDRLLEEEPQALPQHVLQARARHALGQVVQVFCKSRHNGEERR
jgi:hypothetical protein